MAGHSRELGLPLLTVTCGTAMFILKKRARCPLLEMGSLLARAMWVWEKSKVSAWTKEPVGKWEEVQSPWTQRETFAPWNYTRKHSDGLDPGFVWCDVRFKAECPGGNRARTEAETASEVMGGHFQEPRNCGNREEQWAKASVNFCGHFWKGTSELGGIWRSLS